MPTDPYAEFGAPVKSPAAKDPYAEFGAPVAVAKQQPAVAPKPTTQADIDRTLGPPSTVEQFAERGLATPETWNALKGIAGSTWDALKSVPHGAWNDVAGGHVPLIHSMIAQPAKELAHDIPQISGAVRDINASPDPAAYFLKAAGDTATQGAGQDIAALAGTGVGKIIGAAQNHFAPPEANLVEDVYSKPGDHIATALRSNTRVDVPAEAKIAAPAIEEGLNDRGFSTRDFQGRNGPQVLQSGIDNALDIQEARAKSYIDPIRGEKVDPQILAQNPELAARFAPEKVSKLTYGDLDAERIKLNQELRRGNFYSKAPSAQYAAADPMADAHAAANQARNLVYDKVYDTTGADMRPLKQTESALIKLGDLAETTKNTLSAKGAQHAVTPLYKKVGGTVQGVFSAKANPINAFSIPEKAGLFNPLNEFNRNMRNAFPDLDSTARASRTAPPFPSYNLSLTSPGDMPVPIQRLIALSGGEQIPGENLKLTHPEGTTPSELNAQQPLEFEGGHHITAGSIPDILGQALISQEPLTLSPPGDMPPGLQRVLPYTNPGIRSDIFPGDAKKK